MITNLSEDLKQEMLEDDLEEKHAQADYEELMQESAKKRATDAKTIVEKEAQKATAEEELKKAEKEESGAQKELMGLKEMIDGLHKNCDFLVENHAKRKEARTNEIESIRKAKSVLAGADVSVLQEDSSSFVQVGGFMQKGKNECSEDDAARRSQLQQSLSLLQKDVAEACKGMCKEVGASKCDCPEFALLDTTAGVASWAELYQQFDGLQESGRAMLNKYQHA